MAHLIITTFILAALIVAFGLFLNQKLNLLLKKIDKKGNTTPRAESELDKLLIPLKMQAYERMILYVERIELEGLVMRLFFPNMTVQQLQTALTQAIREEYEHNLTQQLYVTETAWDYVKAARMLNLTLIAQASNELISSDNGMKLAELLFSATQNPEVYPYSNYVDNIKREMKKEFGERD